MNAEELDGLERRLQMEHQLNCEAIARVKGLLERAPWAVSGLLGAPAPMAVESNGVSSVARRRVKNMFAGKEPSGQASKTSEAARKWFEGIRPAVEFSVDELTAKVSGATGENSAVVKVRMYAWLSAMRDKGLAVKVGVGKWRKGIGEGAASKPNRAETKIPAGAAGETWREKMERLRQLDEEIKGQKGEGSPE